MQVYTHINQSIALAMRVDYGDTGFTFSLPNTNINLESIHKSLKTEDAAQARQTSPPKF